MLLEDDTGQMRTVAIDRLSKADQEFLAVAGGGEGPTGDAGGLADPMTGVAWYTTVDAALAEAKRSDRPIFFMAAATQCSAVPGVF